MPAPPPVPPPGSPGARLWNLATRLHVGAYRLTGGRLGGRIAGGPVLLLNHVGRRSGRRRVTPLLYLEDGDDLVLVGSRGGSDAPPAWWLNLQAAPPHHGPGGIEPAGGDRPHGGSGGEGEAVAQADAPLPRLRDLPAADGPRDPGRGPQPGRLGVARRRALAGGRSTAAPPAVPRPARTVHRATLNWVSSALGSLSSRGGGRRTAGGTCSLGVVKGR